MVGNKRMFRELCDFLSDQSICYNISASLQIWMNTHAVPEELGVCQIRILCPQTNRKKELEFCNVIETQSTNYVLI